MTTTESTTPARTDAPVLTVRNLAIDFWVDGTWYPAVKGTDFDLHAGEVLAIVGESGSGKSTTAMAMLGLLPKNSHTTGSVKIGDRELIGAGERTMRRVRGREIAVIFQEPMTALNPVYTVGFQIAEMLRTHQAMSPSAARARALELLRLVEIPDPERRIDSYPHQLSGGQRQRVMIAQALALDPQLLLADEPTTALDVTVQAEILRLMRNLKDKLNSGIVLITHDMGVVADMADRIMVMKDGEVVESGTSREIFHNPQHPYTRQLLDAVPHLGGEGGLVRDVAVDTGSIDALIEDHEASTEQPSLAKSAPEKDAGTWQHSQQDQLRAIDSTTDQPVVVSLRGVAVEYPKQGRTPAFRAVDDFTLDIHRGEVVGLVGESGSGKTTVGRALVGLLPFVEGTAEVIGTNMVGIRKKDLNAVRRKVSFVFQDPGSSLNPRLPIGESIGEPLLLHGVAKGGELSKRVEDLLDQVHLSRTMRNRFPHELSGGQRQRVGIARALALEPELLIADEPTSALDVSVQARVLALFQELQREKGFACLFISHDLAVVEMLSARIAVLHHGNLVEVGTRRDILDNPQQDYTKRLLAAVPVPDPDEQKIRRERRDALIAAGVGVEPEDDSVFGAAAVAQEQGLDTPVTTGAPAPGDDGQAEGAAVASFLGTAGTDASEVVSGQDASDADALTTTDPRTKHMSGFSEDQDADGDDAPDDHPGR